MPPRGKNRKRPSLEPAMMTAAEAAEFLRMSLPAFYRAHSLRQIPSHRIGPKRLRFFKAELLAAMEVRRAITETGPVIPTTAVAGDLLKLKSVEADVIRWFCSLCGAPAPENVHTTGFRCDSCDRWALPMPTARQP